MKIKQLKINSEMLNVKKNSIKTAQNMIHFGRSLKIN